MDPDYRTKRLDSARSRPASGTVPRGSADPDHRVRPRISLDAAERQFEYAAPNLWFINQSWPMGTDGMNPQHLAVDGAFKSANKIAYTYDRAAEKISWASGGTQGSAQLNDQTPVYYRMLRLSEPGDRGTLQVGATAFSV